MKKLKNHIYKQGVTSLMLFLLLSGCSFPLSSSVDDILKGMSRVPDSKIVQDALPTYIIMIESMLAKTPDDPTLLQAAAQLYRFYGIQLVEQPERALLITDTALEYAMKAAATTIPVFENGRMIDYPLFEEVIQNATVADLEPLYIIGEVWLEWIRVRKDDMDAIADLPIIQLIMERVVALEPGYRKGMASMYLAVLAAMEMAERETINRHFSRAIEAAGEQNIMPSVFFALWLKNDGKHAQSCATLSDVINKGVPEDPAFSLFNEYAMKEAVRIKKELVEDESCKVGGN